MIFSRASRPESGRRRRRRRGRRRRRRAQLAVAFTMPTGATLVFSHEQSRENNSWSSDGAPAPNAGAVVENEERDKGMRRGESEREGGISEAELYRPLGRQHRHKFVLKVEKPRGRRASLYRAWVVKQMGCTVAASFWRSLPL